MISNEVVKAINQIQPIFLEFNDLSQSYENFKTWLTLNSPNISFYFATEGEFVWHLKFENSQVILVNSDLNEKLNLTCESVHLSIHSKEFNSISLLKANEGNYETSDYLFVPSCCITFLMLKRFKINSCSTEFEVHPEYKGVIKNFGFIFPINRLCETKFEGKK